MKKLKLTAEKREQFLQALADSGSVTAAVAVPGTSRTRVYELRKTDAAFAAAATRPRRSPPTGFKTRRAGER